MPFTPAMQPETIGQQLLRSVKLYAKSLLHVFEFALILSIIAFVPRMITLVTNQRIPLTLSPFTLQTLGLLLIDIGTLIFFIAILWRMRCFIAHVQETLWSEIKRAFRKIPQILVASLILGFSLLLINFVTYGVNLLITQDTLLTQNSFARLAVFVVFFFQFIAAVYIYFLFCFYLPLILTENKSIVSSLKQSAVLVWKNWWRTFCVQVFPWFCYLIALFIIKHVLDFHLHVYFTDPRNITVFSTTMHIIIFAIFIPWPAATLLVQLRDLELRKNLY